MRKYQGRPDVLRDPRLNNYLFFHPFFYLTFAYRFIILKQCLKKVMSRKKDLQLINVCNS